MSDMPPGLPPFMTSQAGGPPPMASGGSFAQSLGAFGTMLKIQETISTRFPISKVPWKDTRVFLRAHTIESIRSTPLYGFMMRLFKDVGLGDMQLIGYAPMHYVFAVPGCPVCNIYPALHNQKVCVATTDALHRFFKEELELECMVEETECVKDSGAVCKFKVSLQPISAYQVLLDENDRLILSGKRPPAMEQSELVSRVEILTIYKLLDRGKLSDIGEAYMQFAGSMPVKEKIFDPPWKTAEELRCIISKHGAFGAAFGEMASKVQSVPSPAPAVPQAPSMPSASSVSPSSPVPPTPSVQEQASKIKDEAKNAGSFAELIAKMKKQN
ncbi:hypothetical protein [uncultured Methanomethylovorans sp.]|uniref:hypothetical protein n=1 Tax=uncultured Methanomethylovorans sp. TaxID=183759 RepID=UPI0026018100|nr:hypothetical protein [uncultured Methanomethylovorans sp.]